MIFAYFLFFFLLFSIEIAAIVKVIIATKFYSLSHFPPLSPTIRLDEKKSQPYDLVWEDKEMLRDKVYYCSYLFEVKYPVPTTHPPQKKKRYCNSYLNS